MSLRNSMYGLICLCLITGCATAPPANLSPEAMFQEGERLYAKKDYDDAITAWKKVKEGAAEPELAARVDLRLGDAQYAKKQYIEAAAAYEDFRKFHPSHDQAAYALYRLALSHYHQIGGIDTEQIPVKNTVIMLEAFLKQYPSSEYAADVRQKLEECRTRQLRYELYVGKFYLRMEKYQAAIMRLEGALANFPGTTYTDELLFRLGQAYYASGERAKGEQALSRLLKEFPASSYAPDARKLMQKG